MNEGVTMSYKREQTEWRSEYLSSSLTLRLTPSERVKLAERAKQAKVTQCELARHYLVEGMTDLEEDLHLTHIKMRQMFELLEENMRFTQANIAAGLMLEMQRQGNLPEVERRRIAREFLEASMRLGQRIHELGFPLADPEKATS
jgi:hypothetical protein